MEDEMHGLTQTQIAEFEAADRDVSLVERLAKHGLDARDCVLRTTNYWRAARRFHGLDGAVAS